MGIIAAIGAQVVAGSVSVDGEEGRQDLRHGWCQRGPSTGEAAAPSRIARTRTGSKRKQLARAPRAQQGREDVPSLQERCAAHQVSPPGHVSSV